MKKLINIVNDCFKIIFNELELISINNLLITSKDFVNKKENFKKYIELRFPKRLALMDWVPKIHEFDMHFKEQQDELMYNAIKLGHLNIIKYIFREKSNKLLSCYNPNHHMMNIAIINGQLKIVKYFYKKGIRYCYENMINDAGENFHLNIIEYLYSMATHKLKNKAAMQAYSSAGAVLSTSEWKKNPNIYNRITTEKIIKARNELSMKYGSNYRDRLYLLPDNPYIDDRFIEQMEEL